MAKLKKADLPKSPRTLEVETSPGESGEGALARKVLMPTVGAAVTANAFRLAGLGELDLPSLVGELKTQCDLASDNKLGRCEEILVSQAHALDAVFNRLAFRAASNMAEHPQAMEIYMRLALKAQSQCRTTLESLAAIKNPPVVYAKNANIAHNQQINNGVVEQVPSPQAEKAEIRPNELLEVPDV